MVTGRVCQIKYRVLHLITLTSDFGLRDAYVAEMKGVISSLSPQAAIVDISHDIPPGDVLHGAHVLRDAAAEFPSGTIHVCVVDPGVGTARRRVLLEVASGKRRATFIGPDNGLFSLLPRESNTVKVWEITELGHLPKRELSTFDGRDVFAPVAALIANGRPPEYFGALIDLHTAPLVDITPPAYTIANDGTILGQVSYIDAFGNAVSNIPVEKVAAPLTHARLLAAGQEFILSKTYDSLIRETPGGIIGSRGFIEIALFRGSAAQTLSLKVGDAVSISPKLKKS